MMKRLVIALTLLALLLPVQAVQAEAADEVRERAFAGLMKLSSIHWETISSASLIFMADGVVKNVVGPISPLKSISCLKGSILMTVFKFILTPKGKSGREVTVNIPVSFHYSPRPRQNSLTIIVTKNGDNQTIHYSRRAVMALDTKDLMIAAYTAEDGIGRMGLPLYMYTIPVSIDMRNAANELCAESNADKLLAIAKRHRLY